MRGYWCVLLAMAGAVSLHAATPRPSYRVEAVAGSARNGDGGPAVSAQFGAIHGVAADRWGNLYISDTDRHRVRKVSAAGTVTTLAGTGVAGSSGDGGPAASAQLNLPFGVAVDQAGSVYIADLGNNRVRLVAPDGAITTYAGGGAATGDGGPATAAQLLAPRNLALDAAGNVYISEFEGHRIRRVGVDGRIATVAGNGAAGFGGDGGLAVWAQIGYPAGIAVDAAGSLYIADSRNNRVRRVLSTGLIFTVLGGAPATALETPVGLAVDAVGNLYVADRTYAVRTYTAGGSWTNMAGGAAQGFSGDGGPALDAQFTRPQDVAADPRGGLYIADSSRVRAVDPLGRIRTVAGDGYFRAIGDGGAATDAILVRPAGLALDALGRMYIADTGTGRVRQVQPGGVIGTAAGSGAAGSAREGDPAADAPLNAPAGVAADLAGNLFIADTYNHRIWMVGGDRRLTAFAGTGDSGMGPDGLLPAETPLRAPRGLCVDRAGGLFVVDTGNHRVLRVLPNTAVRRVAGDGAAGDLGDGGQAPLAGLNQPAACAADSFGNLYVADTLNHRIRKVAADGTIATVAGTGKAGFSGDDGPAAEARLSSPQGLAADDGGNIFIADTGNHRIRLVTPDGVIRTVAGEGTPGWAGDNGPAIEARLNQPGGMFLDGAGHLYFADTGNDRVRRLVPESSTDPATIVDAPELPAVNAASMQSGPVAPGELITIFGAGIGPEEGLSGIPDASGRLDPELGGTEVLFDGKAAPVLYAQASQVTVQVPYSVAGKRTTRVEVRYQDATALESDLTVAEAAPGLFAVALNQNISLNSEESPAARGTVVALFGTGEGLVDKNGVPKLPVSVTIAGSRADVLCAMAAPGLTGALQIYARVPGGVAPGSVPVELKVGAVVSPPVAIWIK